MSNHPIGQTAEQLATAAAEEAAKGNTLDALHIAHAADQLRIMDTVYPHAAGSLPTAPTASGTDE